MRPSTTVPPPIDVAVAVHALSVAFGARRALASVSLTLERGRIHGILGPNGSGKSTLLRCMNRILEPPRGAVRVLGRDVRALSRRALARAIAYVPQQAPIPDLRLSVFDVVRAGYHPHAAWDGGQAADTAAWQALARLGLDADAGRPFGHLSGGQRQTALVARALVQATPVLLLDEPTSHLDPRHQLDLTDLLRRVAQEADLAIGVVLHDLDLALRCCDEVTLLQGGRVVASGSAGEVLTPPRIAEVYAVDAAIVHSPHRAHLVVP
jgi:iron complex transport system ATP-binding protein